MPLQQDLDHVHLSAAVDYSRLSNSNKLKVGAVLVTKAGVMIPGYNGDYPGGDNIIEEEINGELITKPYVIHAELNCIIKAARQGVKVDDSTVYITHSPCVHCASLMVASGIRRVVYKQEYKNLDGVYLLEGAGVLTEHKHRTRMK